MYNVVVHCSYEVVLLEFLCQVLTDMHYSFSF